MKIKALFKLFTTLALINLLTGFAMASMTVDTSKSSLKWVGKKVTGQHDGTVQIKSGSFDLNKGQGSFVIDMKSIDNKDLSGEWKQKLEGHLKSPDFFNVAKFPEAKFSLKNVKKNSGNKYTFTGDLTVKDITKPISFPVTIEKKNNATMVSGKFTIDRLKWDIKYNSGKFFQKLGDKMIYDDIDFELSLVTK